MQASATQHSAGTQLYLSSRHVGKDNVFECTQLLIGLHACSKLSMQSLIQTVLCRMSKAVAARLGA